MSRRSAEFAADVVQWWAEHKAESGDVVKRIQRLETLASDMLSALSFLLEDIHNLEGRPPEALGKRLWTPGGMSMRGDLTRFG